RDIATTFSYDKRGRVLESTNGNGGVTAYTYDGNDRVTSVTGRNSATGVAVTQQRMNYDAAGRLTGSAEALTIDAAGTVIEWAITRQQFDRVGNLTLRTGLAAKFTTLAPPVNASAADVALWMASAPVQPGLDQQTRYVYDKANRLSVTARAQRPDASGITQWAVVSHRYDKNGNVVRTVAYDEFLPSFNAPEAYELEYFVTVRGSHSEHDRNTYMTYDAANRMHFAVDPVGAVTEFVYDGVGNVMHERRFHNPIAIGNWELSNEMIAPLVNNAPARSTSYTYDSENRVKTVDRGTGLIEVRQYDAFGQLKMVTEGARVQRYAYDQAGALRFQIDGGGVVTGTDYDGAGQVVKTVLYALGATFVGAGELGTAVETAALLDVGNALNRATSYVHDAAGNLKTSTDAMGFSESFEYDGMGRKTAFENKIFSRWNYEYDATGNLTAEHSPAVNVIDDAGNESSQSMVMRMQYDALGNLTGRTEAAGLVGERTTRYEYDLAGRQIKTILPAVKVYDPSIDALAAIGSGLAETLEPVSAAMTVSYNALGQAVRNTDALGNVTQKVYNKRGEVRFDIDALGFVTENRYDVHGNRTSLIRYEQGVYAPSGPIASIMSSESTQEAHVLADLANAGATRSRAIETTYNLRNQVVTVREGLGGYHQGQGTGIEQTLTSYIGHRLTTNHYDALGQLIEQRVAINTVGANPASEGSPASVTRFAYNGRGEQVAQLVLADLAENWRDNNVATRRPIETGAYLTTMTYDEAGNRTSVREYGNLVTFAEEDNFWSANWATSGAAHDWRQLAPVQYAMQADTSGRETESHYDLNNNKTSDTQMRVDVDSLQGWQAVATRTNLTTTYGYDRLGNLGSTVDALGGAAFSFYDAVGRVKSVLSQAAYDPSASLDLGGDMGPAPAMTLTDFKRDIHGNVLRTIAYLNGAGVDGRTPAQLAPGMDRTTRTIYNLNGQAIEVIDANNNSSYASYDKLGRVAKQWHSLTQLQTDGVRGSNVATVFQVYHYDAAGRVTEVVAPGTSTATVAASPLRLATLQSAMRRPHATGRDDEGDVIWSYYYTGTNIVSLNYNAIPQAVKIEVDLTYWTGGSSGLNGDGIALLVPRTVVGQANSATFTWNDESNPDGGIGQIVRVVVRYLDAAGVWHVSQEADLAQLTSTDTATELPVGVVNLKHSTTVYNAFGDIVARGQDGLTVERNEFDDAGNLWRTKGADGIAKVFYYNTAGKASLMLRSLVQDDMAGAGTPADLMSYGTIAGIDQTSAAYAKFEKTETLFDLMGRVVAHRSDASAGPTDVVVQPPSGLPLDVSYPMVTAVRAGQRAVWISGEVPQEPFRDSSTTMNAAEPTDEYSPQRNYEGYYSGTNSLTVAFQLPLTMGSGDVRVEISYLGESSNEWDEPEGEAQSVTQLFRQDQLTRDSDGKWNALLKWSRVQPYGNSLDSVKVYKKDFTGIWHLVSTTGPNTALETPLGDSANVGGPYVSVPGEAAFKYRLVGASDYTSAPAIHFGDATGFDMAALADGNYEFIIAPVGGAVRSGQFIVMGAGAGNPVIAFPIGADEPGEVPPPPAPALVRTVFQRNDRWGNVIEI
ncbi:MAG: hypothetical protein WKG03_11105, partial [Telluria sp.]